MERCAKVCYLSTFSCSFWWDYLWCNTYDAYYTYCSCSKCVIITNSQSARLLIHQQRPNFEMGHFLPSQNDYLFELWPSPSLLCKGQFFRWTFTAWQSDAYQSQIISHIWQSASLFFFRNIAVLFQFQWFLEMSSSLDHNLTPPPSISFQVDVVVQQTLREKNGHRLYNTCIPPAYHYYNSYIFSKRVNYILLFPSWKK